jgi:hypothetical protein
VPRQAKPGRAIREVAIPVIQPDLCGMNKAPLSVPIADQVRSRIDAELPGDRGHHSSWHGRRILEEGPQKAHGGKLQGEAETVGGAALLDDPRVVGVIEVEVPGQLLGRRIAGILAVALALRGAQEAHGHGGLPDLAVLHKPRFLHGWAIRRKSRAFTLQNGIALSDTFAIPLAARGESM